MGLRRNSTFHWRDQTHTAWVSSRLLARRGVTVERARLAICAETRYPVPAACTTACAWSWPALELSSKFTSKLLSYFLSHLKRHYTTLHVHFHLLEVVWSLFVRWRVCALWTRVAARCACRSFWPGRCKRIGRVELVWCYDCLTGSKLCSIILLYFIIKY